MPYVQEAFLAQLMIVSFNFAPRGWTFCNGQLLPINQNQALFALLGTTYGGNGQTTFALPDLRGRTPLGQGQNFSGSSYSLGQKGGAESVTLTTAQVPQHTHAVTVNTALAATAPQCDASAANQRTPVGNALASEAAHVTALYAGTANADMQAGSVRFDGPAAVSSGGGSQPHNNLQPYLVLNVCIALQGVFPSQS